jgi:4-hydroxy-tetrahydrodipicolinate synthase
MIEGTLTALITPFSAGEVDVDTLRKLVERQIGAGIHGLVACGTTGEAAAMTPEENLLVIRHVVEQAGGRVPVIAGTGSNSTRQSIEMTRRAASLKVDGVLVVTPYYVKPPQRGLLSHFRQIAAVGVPVVAYNVPSRTGVSLTADTAAELAGIENVVALKEASADLALGAQIISAAGDRLRVLSGDDATYLPLLAVGGSGCICVTSNVAPGEMAALSDHFRAGRLGEARALHQRLLPLMKGLFVESNPIPVKAALATLGLCSWDIRAPLAPLADDLRPALQSTLSACGMGPGEP